MKGRYIGENIRLLYDVLVYTEKNNIPGMFLLVDFQKAFDSLSWSFINQVLIFFNFGSNIKQWVKAFYENVKSCVVVNGMCSTWFHIRRGVRQGDSLSPYLYLLCAEIMSIMIRENTKIKGIKLRQKENKITQFADDTSLCLDGSERSLIESIKILDTYAEISGLQINYDKTQIIWIGSRKNSPIRYLRDKNFCWDPGIFKVLGIKFSVKIDQIPMLNYEGKMNEIKKILSVWSRRDLTPFGKILVLKTLALSKLTYLFANIPDPSWEFLKELDKMFFSFLWNNKPSKISKQVVCQPYGKGGLKMINVFHFLSAMKIGWLRRISAEEFILKDFLFDAYPDLQKILELGGEYSNVLMKRLDNPFWIDVMRHYKKLNSKCVPDNIDEFMSESIHYNSHILVNKSVVYIKEWVRRGIHQIKHLINESGNFLSFEEFIAHYIGIQTNFITYRGIIEAIKCFQRKRNLLCNSRYKYFLNKTWYSIKKGNKWIQLMLLKTDTIPAGVRKWKSNYLNEKFNWEDIYQLNRKTTIDAKLQWFQIKILHRILPTNRYLYIRKIINSPVCDFCKSEEETLLHLFWECKYTKKFWEDFQLLIKEKCTHCINLNLSEILVIFGMKENVKTDRVFDLLLLLGKNYIYNCKWKETRPCISVFTRIIKERYITEKYAFKESDKFNTFNLEWCNYTAIFC
jgi:hypothetical protein